MRERRAHELGRQLVMCAVPAFMITASFLPAVTTGADAIAFGRIDPAGQHVDFVLREQFLDGDLGIRRRSGPCRRA